MSGKEPPACPGEWMLLNMDGRADNANRNWKTVSFVSIFSDGISPFLTSCEWKFSFFREIIFNFLPSQVIGRRQHGKIVSGSESQSQSSICSTPGQSSASNKISSDWPDPPDIPICSTEDEAASIYSDSGEQRSARWKSANFRVTQISIFNEKTFWQKKNNSPFAIQMMSCHIPVWKSQMVVELTSSARVGAANVLMMTTPAPLRCPRSTRSSATRVCVAIAI